MGGRYRPEILASMNGQANGGKTWFFSFIVHSNLNFTHVSVQYLPTETTKSDKRRQLMGRRAVLQPPLHRATSPSTLDLPRTNHTAAVQVRIHPNVTEKQKEGSGQAWPNCTIPSSTTWRCWGGTRRVIPTATWR